MSDLPARRVVLLGASNLTRGFTTAVETSCRIVGSPLDVLAAHGHGRSYGLRTRVLIRGLPGITSCRLWPVLAARPPAPTIALLTDIGNDILYGAPVAQILEWVTWCLDRLAEQDAQVVMTLLPLASARKTGPWKFGLMRRILFPNSTLTLDRVLALALELDAGLRTIAAARQIELVEPREDWYGFDPIHIRRRLLRIAWNEILSSWRSEESPRTLPPRSRERWPRISRLAPDERTILGSTQHRIQPAATLADGTTISLY